MVACVGQIALVCQYRTLTLETGPVKEQTGSEPESGPPQTGRAQ